MLNEYSLSSYLLSLSRDYRVYKKISLKLEKSSNVVFD